MVRGAANAFEAIERLRAIYCATSGHDFAQVFVPDERVWLRESVEARRFRPPADPIDGRELLDRITQVEVFERFLHRTFPGKTRFSIEGLDLMIPMLDEIIADAAASGVTPRAHRHGAPRPAERARARDAASRTRRSWPSSRIRSSRAAAASTSAGWAT